MDYLKLGAAAGIALALTAAGGFMYRAGQTSVQADWNAAKAEHADALAAEEAAHRATERRLLGEMEALQDESRQKLTELAGVLAGVAVERDGVSVALAESRKRASEAAAAAGSCAAIQSAADLYAELFGELQSLAEGYAQTADRSRLAGAACEAAFARLAVRPSDRPR